MLQRKNDATLAEIVDKMGWQKYTIRGFIAGAMKKAGFSVESFKSEWGIARLGSSSSQPIPSQARPVHPAAGFLTSGRDYSTGFRDPPNTGRT
jgi:hypothetical protein